MNGYVKLYYKKNDIVLCEEKHNLIVNQAEIITANLLANSGISGITKFIVGDSAVHVTDKSHTALIGNTYSNSVGTIVVSGGKITIPFSLTTSEFNGYEIWQFGLMTTDNQLFSILSRMSLASHPTIIKDTNTTVDGEWIIEADI